jgi:hypothetical protein
MGETKIIVLRRISHYFLRLVRLISPQKEQGELNKSA